VLPRFAILQGQPRRLDTKDDAITFEQLCKLSNSLFRFLPSLPYLFTWGRAGFLRGKMSLSGNNG
jgi:hypothetical protein